MADKIYAISKRPGCPPRSVWVSNSLENLQRYVDGYIETFTFATDMCAICDEQKHKACILRWLRSPN